MGESTTEYDILIESKKVKQVEEFVYLSSMFTNDSKHDRDIERRVNAGNKINGALLAIMNSKSVSRQARLAIHNGVMIPTLMKLDHLNRGHCCAPAKSSAKLTLPYHPLLEPFRRIFKPLFENLWIKPERRNFRHPDNRRSGVPGAPYLKTQEPNQTIKDRHTAFTKNIQFCLPLHLMTKIEGLKCLMKNPQLVSAVLEICYLSGHYDVLIPIRDASPSSSPFDFITLNSVTSDTAICALYDLNSTQSELNMKHKRKGGRPTKTKKGRPKANRASVEQYSASHLEVNQAAVSRYNASHSEVNQAAVPRYRASHPEVNRQNLERRDLLTN
ncbi:hypothetical protein EVAR_78268_1 [Eumeta japonica]|uniref:Uncharacterized protein n=1 Tax=Eumeta variegata TaxID=151549 RepID=A0A4C1T2Z3_EUMVA|nr:hypothetical protein EVAR_78268_1 [Eumeta japonica]